LEGGYNKFLYFVVILMQWY